eukprot:TRINITY_DN5269_c0_g1_i1.p1 TRINITY_DN5269_c0_g1~~TRINITY_DN5269_c0_g1_i1.p1  ORF type:complete len:395 (-),score=120.21 TRINITY_DN5269_c0_g1_i1:42-1226(-)
MSGEQQARQFLEQAILVAPSEQIKNEFAIMKELYDQKLWHNLTEKLVSLIDQINGDDLKQIYNGFIKYFENHINQFTLAQIAVRVASAYPPSEGIQFLKSLADKFSNDPALIEPSLYLSSSILLLSLSLGLSNEAESKTLLDSFESSLKSLPPALSVPGKLSPLIYSNYHLALSQYYQLKNSLPDFYTHSMLYLSYTPLSSIPPSLQVSLATSLALSALTSESLYSFGDLLNHPILNSLQNTNKQYLISLLTAFNRGDMESYTKLADGEYAAIMNNEEGLKGKAGVLKIKIAVLGLMELVLERGSGERVFKFSEIESRCRVERNDVERLVMRGMSLGLVKGVIDEVEEKVVISWVQPRVLDIESVKKMRDRLEDWRKKVHATLVFVEQQTGNEI